MKKASTYAIFALLVCALPWTSQAHEVPQECVDRYDGKISGLKNSSIGVVPMDQGPVQRLYIPGTENLKVVGSYLRFCDDQIKKVKMELGDDKRSYIVHRKDDSLRPSHYKMTVYYSGDEPVQRNKNRWQQNKRPAAKKTLRHRRLH